MCIAALRDLVLGFDMRQLEARFEFRTPADAAQYRRLGCRVRFGRGLDRTGAVNLHQDHSRRDATQRSCDA